MQPEQINTRFLVVLEQKLPEPETIIQNRNLSDYDIGGNFSNCFGTELVDQAEMRKCATNLDKARNFILNHWQTRKRGYIVHKTGGRDNGKDFHIFIEPDENGKWRIVERSEKSYSTLSRLDCRQVISQDIRMVKRKSATEDVDHLIIGKYYLSFLDKYGEEVETL